VASIQHLLSFEADPVRLTLGELDGRLFKCTDIVRNAFDETASPDVILPLVFNKTISAPYQGRFEGVAKGCARS